MLRPAIRLFFVYVVLSLTYGFMESVYRSCEAVRMANRMGDLQSLWLQQVYVSGNTESVSIRVLLPQSFSRRSLPPRVLITIPDRATVLGREPAPQAQISKPRSGVLCLKLALAKDLEDLPPPPSMVKRKASCLTAEPSVDPTYVAADLGKAKDTCAGSCYCRGLNDYREYGPIVHV